MAAISDAGIPNCKFVKAVFSFVIGLGFRSASDEKPRSLASICHPDLSPTQADALGTCICRQENPGVIAEEMIEIAKQSVEEDCRSAEDIVELVPARQQAFRWSMQRPAGTFP